MSVIEFRTLVNVYSSFLTTYTSIRKPKHDDEDFIKMFESVNVALKVVYPGKYKLVYLEDSDIYEVVFDSKEDELVFMVRNA